MRNVRLTLLGLLTLVVVALAIVSAHAEQFANFALSTLATSIGSTDTTLTLSSTTNFPNSAPFRLTIQDSAVSTPEIVYVTAISGNTYTITRGYEGTTATGHSAGAQVAQFVTAGVISSLSTSIGSALQATNNLSDLSNAGTARTNLGLAASATTDTTNASNISSGTLPAARLPNPSASTLGGIQSLVSAAHQWINGISTAGAPSTGRPACADLSDSSPSCATDTTNASNISSGSLANARLPIPSGAGNSGAPNCRGYDSVAACEQALGYSDIRLHGGNCNGSGDDGPALQNAANAANTGGWKRVFVPNGTCNIVTGFSNPGNGTTIFSTPQHVFYDPTTIDGGQLYFNTGYSGFVPQHGTALDMNGHNLNLEHINISGDGAQSGISGVADSVTYVSGPLPELNANDVSITRMGVGIGCQMNNTFVTPGSNNSGACIGSLQGNLISIRGHHLILSQNGWGINANVSDLFLDTNTQIAGNNCGGVFTTSGSQDGIIAGVRFDENGGGTGGGSAMCTTANWADLTVQGRGFSLAGTQFELGFGPGVLLTGSWQDFSMVGGHFLDNGAGAVTDKDANIVINGTAGGSTNTHATFTGVNFTTIGSPPKYDIRFDSSNDNKIVIDGTAPSGTFSTSLTLGTLPSEYRQTLTGQPYILNGQALSLSKALSAGTVTPAISGATFATDASQGNYFHIALSHAACACTLSNPTNPTDGEIITYEVQQSASGNDTIGTYGTAFNFGTAGAPTLSTGASKIDILAFRYSATNSKWNYLGDGLGF